MLLLLTLKQISKFNKHYRLFYKVHIEESTDYNINRKELAKLKDNTWKEKSQRNTKRLQSLGIGLPPNKIRLNEINQENGASMWLSTLPLKEQRYSLSRQEFRDLVKIRSGLSYLALQTYFVIFEQCETHVQLK